MIFHVQLFLFHGKLVVWVGGLDILGISAWKGIVASIFYHSVNWIPPHFPRKQLQPFTFLFSLLTFTCFFGVSFLETGRGLSRLWPQALQKAGVSFKASWSWWKFQPVSAEVAGLSCRCLLSLSSRDFYFTKKKWKKPNSFLLKNHVTAYYTYIMYKTTQICSMDPNGQNPISIARLFEGINLRDIIDTHTHKMHHSTYT